LTGPGFVTDWRLEGDAINVGTIPEFMVGLATPLMNPYTYPAIVIIVFDLVIVDTTEPINFYIDGIWRHSLPERVPAYLDGANYDIIKPLQQVTGGPEFAVATINGECAIAIENQSWGNVKSLYR
jgi:hypothetical protein